MISAMFPWNIVPWRDKSFAPLAGLQRFRESLETATCDWRESENNMLARFQIQTNILKLYLFTFSKRKISKVNFSRIF